MDNQIFNKNEIEINWKIKKPGLVWTYIICIFIILILGITDYLSGIEMSFSIFYLIPITIAVLLSNFINAIIISFISVAVWYSADLLAGHYYSTFLIPIWNAIMRLGYFILHSYILSKVIELYNVAKIKSYTDPLTEVSNWRFFHEIFNRELKKAKRTNLPFTIVYIDLDNFKLMNDKYGHSSGDYLLQMISKHISENIRPTDILSRLGGDEFAILLPETDYQESEAIIKRTKEIVSFEINNKNWPVTLSLGLVTFRIFNLTIDEMIKKADDLMYEVKSSGKNNISHQIWE